MAIMNNALAQTEPITPARTTYQEILVRPQLALTEAFNELTAPERVMAYYLYRAILPANHLLADQLHRHACTLIQLFVDLYQHKDLLRPELGDDFIQDIETYMVYLALNKSPYFIRDHGVNKRTPPSLGLSSITPETLRQAVTLAHITPHAYSLDELHETIFNPDYEQILTVVGSIESSATNFHAPGMTTADFKKLPTSVKESHTMYVFDEHGNPVPSPLFAYGHGDKELSVSLVWFERALTHARTYPEYFDEPFALSLEYLIKFLKSGNEEDFKDHFKAWIKTNSRLDYSFGPIETYDDPMEITGSMQGEITIKKVSLKNISAILPEIERTMPIPDEYKRTNTNSLPNASVNIQLYATGHLGALVTTLAYCLPNWPDIRSEYGSKQIMYSEEKSIAETLSPVLAKKLWHTPAQYEWLTTHDDTGRLTQEIRELLTLLHETIGHASGSQTQHTFKPGEDLTYEGTTYNVGDTVKLTGDNAVHFMRNYDSALEELRAEIIALYVATHHLDELVNAGFLRDTVAKHGNDTILEWLIQCMAVHGIYRLASQPEGNTDIVGAHAQGNAVITNYLLRHGGINLTIQPLAHEGTTYNAVNLEVRDLQAALKATKELMQLVQSIRSTADGIEAEKLFNEYGKKYDVPNLKETVINNRKLLVGNLRVTASLFPNLKPVLDTSGKLTDVTLEWPTTITEQILNEDKRALSTELMA